MLCCGGHGEAVLLLLPKAEHQPSPMGRGWLPPGPAEGRPEDRLRSRVGGCRLWRRSLAMAMAKSRFPQTLIRPLHGHLLPMGEGGAHAPDP